MFVENNTGGAVPAVSNPAPIPETAVPAAAVAPAAPALSPSPETAPAAPAPVAVSPASAAESAPAQSAPVTEAPKPASTILGTEPPKKEEAPKADAPKPVEENKPAEGDKPAEQPQAEDSQSAEPASLPTYERFTLPEGIQIDEKKLGEFTKELGEFQNSTKADQVEMQRFGQKLMDRYVAETQETIKRIDDYYKTTWEKTKNEMREQFVKDPELGGNRQETTAATVQNFVSEFGGNEQQIGDLRKYMDTGVGNKVELIRLMNNAANAVNNLRMKYESESGTRPLPGQKPVTEKKSKTQTLYGKTAASS